jgi:hypothetical protein
LPAACCLLPAACCLLAIGSTKEVRIAPVMEGMQFRR